MPLSASTHRPESSETAGRPVKAAIARALSSAFSSNVAPVSGTSGAPGNSSRPASLICSPPSREALSSAPRIRASSRSLAAFRVASTTVSAATAVTSGWVAATGGPAITPARHLAAWSARRSRDGEVEQLAEQVAAERLPLGRALDLHEVAASGADHVHVGLRGHVLLVAQVEPGLAVHDADTDRGHRGEQRVALGPLAVLEPGDRLGQRDVPAGHGRGPGAAVGLEHVAVDDDGVLAERL